MGMETTTEAASKVTLGRERSAWWLGGAVVYTECSPSPEVYHASDTALKCSPYLHPTAIRAKLRG